MPDKSFVLMALICLNLSASAYAEEVVLKSGEKLEGKIVEQTPKYIKMDPGIGMVMTYYTDEIDTIDGQKLAIPSKPQPLASAQAAQANQFLPVAAVEADAPDNHPAQTPPENENDEIAQAAHLVNDKDYEGALAILNKLDAQGTGNFAVYAYRAGCFEAEHRDDEAIHDYIKAIHLYPGKSRALYNRVGYLYLKKRNGAQAEYWLYNYVKSFPQDGEAYYGLAIAMYDQQHYEEALNYLQQARQLGYDSKDMVPFGQQVREAQAERDRRNRQQYTYHTSSSSSNSGKDIGYAIFGFFFGIFSFFHGLKKMREKKLIESIPASTVRGLAMGLVELNGRAKNTKVFEAPLTATPCIFYKYTVERYESSGKSGHWVMVSSGDTSYCPFFLNDDTGQIMVWPSGAEFVMPVDYTFSTGFAKPLPDNLLKFMEQNNLPFHGAFGNYTLRFNEWHIKPDEPVFVVGTAQKNNGQWEALDVDRWMKQADGTEMDVIIAKGSGEDIFVVSDESQKKVVQEFSWKAFCGIWGGPVLTVSTLAYLLFRFGIWEKF